MACATPKTPITIGTSGSPLMKMPVPKVKRCPSVLGSSPTVLTTSSSDIMVIALARSGFPAQLEAQVPRGGRRPEEAGDRLFTFTRLDLSQWKSARTTNAIERLNEEFRRRVKIQTVLPCAEIMPMLLWVLLAPGQIQMRKVDGWETLSHPLVPMSLDLAA